MTQTPTSPEHTSSPGPNVVWLAAAFFLAGLGTVVLGPILPTVAYQWGLTDAASGSLFLTKFTGSFFGGALVSRHLRANLVLGALLSAAGFALFAFAPGVHSGAAWLTIAGFGLGQVIASSNILSSLRFRSHTGSALAAINFFFSLGAVLTGVLVGSLLPRLGLRGFLLVFSALFALCGVGSFISSSRNSSHYTESSSDAATPVPWNVVLLFGALLFLYGGLETSLSSWLTTFSQRFGVARALGEQSAIVIFWASLTAGRALASLLLRWLSERTVQAAGMLVVAALTTLLATTHHRAEYLGADCIVLGLAIAPFFPATFALLMRHAPPPRLAGIVLAVSGLGAALFPWLMGMVSTHTGSLRTAMLIPAALAVALLLVSRVPASAMAKG